ncbi:nSTAND1 domain-containing NTPase [Nocardiopsis coralliicola]
MAIAPVEAALVSVRRAGAPESSVGSGFLVSESTVLTCAHVVSRALGRPEDARISPEDRILLAFPLVDAGAQVSAEVVRLESSATGDPADVAVLRLRGPVPGGARPVRIVADDDASQSDVRVGGFPLGRGLAAWANCTVVGRAGLGLLQVEDQRIMGTRVGKGFSGGPLWSDVHQGVLGMVALVDPSRDRRTSFAVSGLALSRVVPEPARAAVPPTPYRGLRPFEAAHAHLFFGRAELSRALAADWDERRRNVLLTGPSGAGKSSVLMAGVLPLLGESVRERCLLVRPDELSRHRDELEAAVRRGDGDGSGGDGSGDDGGVRLVAVDQVEEVEDPRDRDLLRRLAAAASRPESPVRCLFAVRSDHLGAVCDRLGLPDGHAPAAAGVQDEEGGPVAWRRHEVPPMTDEQVARVVEGPLPPGVTLGPGLLPVLLEAARKWDTDTPALPLLQLTLARLWDERRDGVIDHRAYERVGGLRGAVHGYAEQIWERLGEPDRDVARRLFLRLVRVLRDAPPIGRAVPLSDLSGAEADLVRRPAADGLLAVHGRGEAAVVRFTHDAVIAHWGRLSTWIDDDRALLIHRDDLHADADRWSRADEEESLLLRGPTLTRMQELMKERPDYLGAAEHRYLAASTEEEAQRRTRKRQWAAGLSILVALALVAAVAAEAWRRQAGQEERAAASQELAAEFAQALRHGETALLKSVAAYRTAPTRAATELLSRAYFRTRALDRLMTPPGMAVGDAPSPTVTRDLHRVGLHLDDRMYLWRRTDQGYEEEALSGTAALAGAVSPDGSRTALQTPDGVRLYGADGAPIAELPLGSDEPLWQAIEFSPSGGHVGFYDAERGDLAVHTTGPRPEEVLRVPAPPKEGTHNIFALSEDTLYADGLPEDDGPVAVAFADGARTRLEAPALGNDGISDRITMFSHGPDGTRLLACDEQDLAGAQAAETEIEVHRPVEDGPTDQYTSPVRCSIGMGLGLDGRYLTADASAYGMAYVDAENGQVEAVDTGYGKGTPAFPAPAGPGVLRTAHFDGAFDGVGISTVDTRSMSASPETLGLTLTTGGDRVLNLSAPFQQRQDEPVRGDGVEVWAPDGTERLGEIDLPGAFAATADDERIVAVGEERVQVHAMNDQRLLWDLDLPGSALPQVSAADREHLLVVQDSGRARAYDLADGDPAGPEFTIPVPEGDSPAGGKARLRIDPVPGEGLLFRAVSPDNDALTTWDARSGERTATTPLPSGGALIAFHHSPDEADRGLAYTFTDNDGWDLSLWDLGGDAPRREKSLLTGFGISSLASDVSVIAVMDGDTTLRMWDYSGEELLRAELPSESANEPLAVHGDTQTLLVRGRHGGAQTYSLDPQEWMRHVCQVAGDRELTEEERSDLPAAVEADGVCEFEE